MIRPLASCFVLLSLSACAPEMPGGEPAPASSAAAVNETALVIGGVDLAKPLKFAGTEPFWSLSISETDIVFERPDAAPRHFNAGVFHANGDQAELRSGELSTIVTGKSCSDGMSDRQYPLTAEVRIGDTVYKGCAMAAADMAKDHP